MQDTYYRIDMDGRIVMASPAASVLLGYDVNELVGVKLTDLYVDPVPIRLSPIPTTSRVLPIPRVKLGLGRAAISPAMSSAS